MGKVLAYGAAIRGGLFSRSSSDDQKLILTSLLKCGHKKMYIPFASSSFIRDLLIIVSGHSGFSFSEFMIYLRKTFVF